jgi:hypothetical protein
MFVFSRLLLPDWAALRVREKKKRTNKQTQKNIFKSQKNAKCSVLQRTQGRQLPLLLQRYNLTITVLGLAFPFLPYTRTHRQQRRVSNLHGMESMMKQETTTTSFDPLIRLQSFFRWIYFYRNLDKCFFEILNCQNTSIFRLQPNLAKYSCTWSPFWLHHKIDRKKKND